MSKVSGWFNKKLKRSSGASHAEEQPSQDQWQDPSVSQEGSLETPGSHEQSGEQHQVHEQYVHEHEPAEESAEIEIVHEPTPESNPDANMAQFEKKKKGGGLFSKFSGGVAFKKKKASSPAAEEPEPHQEPHQVPPEPYYPPHVEPEPAHFPEPVIQQPAYIRPEPQVSVQTRGITKRQKMQQEAEQEEAIGMSYMKQYQDRIRTQRQSMAAGYGAFYGAPRAPGFDYVHWKPRGKVRSNYGGPDYDLLCNALAPYVRCVVVSGCEGAEERRWAALTESAETNSRPLQSRVASRDVL